MLECCYSSNLFPINSLIKTSLMAPPYLTWQGGGRGFSLTARYGGIMHLGYSRVLTPLLCEVHTEMTFWPGVAEGGARLNLIDANQPELIPTVAWYLSRLVLIELGIDRAWLLSIKVGINQYCGRGGGAAKQREDRGHCRHAHRGLLHRWQGHCQTAITPTRLPLRRSEGQSTLR